MFLVRIGYWAAWLLIALGALRILLGKALAASADSDTATARDYFNNIDFNAMISRGMIILLIGISMLALLALIKSRLNTKDRNP
ncbi:hypothetical protein KO498_03690 [Lentibacter algarum]|uniref:hypothetical protein n=1 Tax=Lentibacter algarum TaxID=576131 RepID=UPI001C076265|nr:hypothetical protein [Lentibacter algarum]MBU2980909.1 hypothetical protein [Lentibacter algarum]